MSESKLVTDEWEMIPKGKNHFSPFLNWPEKPCVSIHQQGLTFSAAFCDTYGLKEGTPLVLLFNEKHLVVGIKVAVSQIEQDASYAAKKLARNTKSLQITCSRFTKRIDEMFIGKVYHCRMENGSPIITFRLEEPLE